MSLFKQFTSTLFICCLFLANYDVSAQADMIIWENQGADNAPLPSGSVLTTVNSTNTPTIYWMEAFILNEDFSDGNEADYVTIESDGRSVLELEMNSGLDEELAKVVVNIHFSTPISNLEFSITDISETSNHDDNIEVLLDGRVFSTVAGTSATLTNVLADNESQVNGYEGDDAFAADSGKIDFNSGSLTSFSILTIKYLVGDDASSNPSDQDIEIGDLSFITGSAIAAPFTCTSGMDYVDFTVQTDNTGSSDGDASGIGTFDMNADLPNFTWTVEDNNDGDTDITEFSIRNDFDPGTSTYTDLFGDPVGEEFIRPRIETSPSGTVKSDQVTLTFTFDSPTPTTGWGMYVGDLDVEQILISATDLNGNDVSASDIASWIIEIMGPEFFAPTIIEDFSSTSIAVVGGLQTSVWHPGGTTWYSDGISGDVSHPGIWFAPDVALKSITIEQINPNNSESSNNASMRFNFGTCLDALLPVELISFSATPLENQIELKWSTATELNNKEFEILRSTDGIEFKKIGKLEGQINSTQVTDYGYTDSDVASNTRYYYKLNQVDLDGQNSNSKVVSAMISKHTDIERKIVLLSNPVLSSADVELRYPAVSPNTRLTIYDLSGKVIQSQQYDNLSLGWNNMIIDLKDGMMAGTYILSDGKGLYQKFVLTN